MTCHGPLVKVCTALNEDQYPSGLAVKPAKGVVLRFLHSVTTKCIYALLSANPFKPCTQRLCRAQATSPTCSLAKARPNSILANKIEKKTNI